MLPFADLNICVWFFDIILGMFRVGVDPDVISQSHNEDTHPCNEKIMETTEQKPPVGQTLGKIEIEQKQNDENIEVITGPVQPHPYEQPTVILPVVSESLNQNSNGEEIETQMTSDSDSGDLRSIPKGWFIDNTHILLI